MKVALMVTYYFLTLFFMMGYMGNKADDYKDWFVIITLIISPLLAPALVMIEFGRFISRL
jgi:hypothetical protein